jgi:methionine transaminase
MPNIFSKLPQVGTTIFTTMSALAVEHKAINLGQGFPDFMMDETLIDLVTKSMKVGNNQYVHMNGLPFLREAIAQKVYELYENSVNPNDEITVTPGATYAIYTALTCLLQPNDEVIVFEPAYDSYIPNIVVNGAKPVIVKLSYPNYAIPWDEVKQKINSNTKLLMINTPHNPTGMVLNENDIIELQQIVESNPQLFLLSDEVYEHLIFDDKKHLSFLKYPSLYERSFITFSFGKTYHCTGWKIGYCIAPKALTAEFRKIHQFNCFTTNSTVQFALAEYLKSKDAYLQLGSQIEAKRNLLRNLMQQTPLKPIGSSGSYFECYSYENVSTQNDGEMAIELVKEAKVATIPTSVFYSDLTDNKVLRFCFAKKDETLEKAVDNLIKYFNK